MSPVLRARLYGYAQAVARDLNNRANPEVRAVELAPACAVGLYPLADGTLMVAWCDKEDVGMSVHRDAVEADEVYTRYADALKLRHG